MTATIRIADALDDFDTRHGTVTMNALAEFAERMRKAAASCEADYEKARNAPPGPAPEPVTHPDGSQSIELRPTPAGYLGIARLFGESADKADAAARAYETLIGLLPS
jgi:hypothetical protein